MCILKQTIPSNPPLSLPFLVLLPEPTPRVHSGRNVHVLQQPGEKIHHMLYQAFKAQKEMGEAQGNRRLLSLVLEALCLEFEASKMAQEENLSWLNSQESKEGADPGSVPDVEDFLPARLQLLLFTSSVLYLQCLSPAPIHSFFFCATSLVLAFSLYPAAIPSHHRNTPGLTHISHVVSTCLHQGPFWCSLAFTIRFFPNHEFLIPIRNFLIPCAALIEKTVVS